MSKKDRRLSRPIDIQHAGQMVDAFSLSCGAPCTLLDENGQIINEHFRNCQESLQRCGFDYFVNTVGKKKE